MKKIILVLSVVFTSFMFSSCSFLFDLIIPIEIEEIQFSDPMGLPPSEEHFTALIEFEKYSSPNFEDTFGITLESGVYTYDIPDQYDEHSRIAIEGFVSTRMLNTATLLWELSSDEETLIIVIQE